MTANEQPKITVGTGEMEVEITRDNGSLYRFLGQASVYDHVFVYDKEEETALYIFKTNESFDFLAKFMIKNRYPLHVNLRPDQVQQCDLNAYETMIAKQTQDVGEFVPDGWQ